MKYETYISIDSAIFTKTRGRKTNTKIMRCSREVQKNVCVNIGSNWKRRNVIDFSLTAQKINLKRDAKSRLRRIVGF